MYKYYVECRFPLYILCEALFCLTKKQLSFFPPYRLSMRAKPVKSILVLERKNCKQLLHPSAPPPLSPTVEKGSWEFWAALKWAQCTSPPFHPPIVNMAQKGLRNRELFKYLHIPRSFTTSFVNKIFYCFC